MINNTPSTLGQRIASAFGTALQKLPVRIARNVLLGPGPGTPSRLLAAVVKRQRKNERRLVLAQRGAYRVWPQAATSNTSQPEVDTLGYTDLRLNINTCGASELTNVGVPAALASTILQARPFQTLEQVLNLRGVGPVRAAMLRQHFKV